MKDIKWIEIAITSVLTVVLFHVVGMLSFGI